MRGLRLTIFFILATIILYQRTEITHLKEKFSEAVGVAAQNTALLHQCTDTLTDLLRDTPVLPMKRKGSL